MAQVPVAKPKMQVVIDDPSLEHFKGCIQSRYERYLTKKLEIENVEGSLQQFATGYDQFGIHKTATGIIYKEWAPEATSICLFGEFNNWQRNQYTGKRDEFGVWTVFIPNEKNMYVISHGQKLKAGLTIKDGRLVDRIPA